MRKANIKIAAIAALMLLNTQNAFSVEANSYDSFKDAVKGTGDVTVDLTGDVNWTGQSKNSAIKLGSDGVSNNLTVNGNGNAIKVDDSIKNAINTIVFDVQPDSTLNLNNLTISGFGKGTYGTEGSPWGGTVYTEGTLNLDNVNISSNLSKSGTVSGGAVSSVGKAITTITGNSTFDSNESQGQSLGGAIYNVSEMSITAGDGKTIKFTNNNANRGGALYNGIYSGSEAKLVGAGKLDMKAENSGIILFENNTSKNGGAFSNAGTATISGENVVFRNNRATAYGGAICNDGTLDINGGTFDSNYLTSGTGGGAIYNGADSRITMSGKLLFNKNYTTGNVHGGAIRNEGTINISGDDAIVKFTENSANGSGGAIYNGKTGRLYMSGSGEFLFDKNTGTNGGAIYNEGILELKDGKYTFSNNTAKSSGGAMYNSGNIIMVGSRDSSGNASIVFDSNRAAGRDRQGGGALFVYGNPNSSAVSFLDIQGVDFKNNSTQTHGGALFLENNVDFNIINTTFTGNNTTSSDGQGWGGAIGLGKGHIAGYIADSVFTKNHSTDAGGVVAANTALTFVNTKFYENSARYSGGAISYDPLHSTDQSMTSDGRFLKIIADGGDTIFDGNNVTDSHERSCQGQEALFIANALPDVAGDDGLDSNVYLNAGNSGSIIFNDIVNATGKSKDSNVSNPNKNIQLNKSGVEYGALTLESANAIMTEAPTNGKIVFNNTVRGANLVLHNGTLAFRQENSLGHYVAPTADTKYFSDGAKITLKGGTLDLLNKYIESGDNFNPESINVIGNSNLWLDIKLGRASDDDTLTGSIDRMNSDIIGSGKLLLSKFSFEDKAMNNVDDFSIENFNNKKFTTTLTFANNNKLADGNTILEDSLATVITSNAGYKLELTNDSSAGKGKNALQVTQVVNAGGLPVAVSLGQDRDLAAQRTYIYNATADEIIGEDGNTWNKGYKIYNATATTIEDRKTSNVLQGDLLQINGNGKNVIGANNVVGIALGVNLNDGSKQQQELKISDVKKSDGTGWYGFNTAVINDGGKVTLEDSIFSNNNSSQTSYKDISENSYTKAGDGGAVINKNYVDSSDTTNNKTGELNIINTSFKNNTANGKGGAIYNEGTTNITVTDSNAIEFTDNSDGSGANDIYNVGNLNLISSLDGKIVFNSGISGDSTNWGTINIGVDANNTNLGNVILNSTVSNQNVNLNSGTLTVGTTNKVFDNVNLTMNGGTLNSINNKIDTIDVKDLAIGSTQSTFMFDVDLSQNNKSDVINVAQNIIQDSNSQKLLLGPLNILNKMADGQNYYQTEFINKDAISAEIAAAAQHITVDGVTYNLSVNKNVLTIAIAGESGGFNYEVINGAIGSRTYQVTKNEDVINWIAGNHTLAGSEFYIKGNGDYAINGSASGTALEGIILGLDETRNQQKLDIVDVASYKGFDTAVINNGGLVYISNSTLEDNNATLNGGSGGAIRNLGGEVDIVGSAIFQNNTATGNGGAIYNTGVVDINATSVTDVIKFTGNKSNGNDSDIYSTGSIKLQGNGTVQFDGGIAGSGDFNSSVVNLLLNGKNSDYKGSFSQTSGKTTVAKDATFFGGTSTISGGELVYNSVSDLIQGAALKITGGKLTLGNGTDTTKLTITGNSNIENADVSINNNAILALVNKDYTVTKLSGNGTLSAKNSNLTVNNSSDLTNASNLKLNTEDSSLSVIGVAADTAVGMLKEDLNKNLKLTLDNSKITNVFNFTKDAISKLETKNTVSLDDVTYNGQITNTGDLTLSGNFTSDENGKFDNSNNVAVNGNASNYKGAYNQTAGMTTVTNSSNVFGGAKNINGGEFVINNGEINYTNMNLGNGSTLTHTLNTATGVKNTINSSVLKFVGSGAKAEFLNGDINLAENLKNGNENNTISITNGKIVLGTSDYTGGTKYQFKDADLNLKLDSNGNVQDYKFTDLETNNTGLTFNVKLVDDDDIAAGTKKLVTDTITTGNAGQTFKFGNIYLTGEENGWRGEYKAEKDVLQDATFAGEPNPDEIMVTGATTSWVYKVRKTAENNSITMEIDRAAGANTLYNMNNTKGTRFFQFSDNGDHTIDQKYNIDKSLSETMGQKVDGVEARFDVSGYDREKCTISGAIVDTSGNLTGEHGSFFDIKDGTDVTLNINKVSIVEAEKTGSGSVVSNASSNGVVNITDTIISNNKSTEKGGAIYNDNNGTVNITDTVFTENKSNAEGGAIYNNATMKLTNVILNKSTGNGKNDFAQGAAGNTTLAGRNYVYSGISGEGNIENTGYLELNGGNNYEFKGNYKQGTAGAVTKVVGNDDISSSSCFGGTSTITNGTLWWMSNDKSGKLDMSGSSILLIGGENGEGAYNLELENGDIITDSVNVKIGEDSTLAISNAGVTLNENDSWLGMVRLTGNGNLTLDNLQSNGDIKAGDGGILTLKSGNLFIDSWDSLIEATSKVNIDKDGKLVISDSNVTLNGTSTGNVAGFDDSDTWNGEVYLQDGGTLTAGGFATNGVLKAISGNLKVSGDALNIGAGSVITDSVNTEIGNGSNLKINGGDVVINENDQWYGKITLEDGNLLIKNFDNEFVNGEGLETTKGNLSIVNSNFVMQDDNYKIAKDTKVYLDTETRVQVKGGELNLDNEDTWYGEVYVNGGDFVGTKILFDGSNGQKWKQVGGSTTFKDSYIQIEDEDNGAFGGDLKLINSGMRLGAEACTLGVDNLYMKDSSINSMNGYLEEHEISSTMKVNGTNNFAIDIAPRFGEKGESDMFTIGKLISNGTLNVADFNFIGATPIERQLRFRVFNADEIDSNVKFTATNKEIFTPIGYYNLQSAGGGWYTSNMVRYNPQVFRGQVATIAAFNNQLMIDDMLLNHVTLDSERLLAEGKNANKYAATLPQFAPYQYRKEDGGLWFKSYVNFENLSLTQGLKVGNNSYGTLVGADFPVVKMKRGWKFMPTAYIGYNGAHQTFNGVGMYQNGGQGGFMGTFMKNDFIGSVLAYGGGYNNEMSVAGYTDHTGNWFAGTAAKLAYNLHATKHFTIQPTAFVSYNIFGKQHWGTDYGAMSMNSGLMNGINVAPGLNFIYARETWSAYATFQYMYNINDQVGGRAGNVDLSRVEMKHGYIQYGVGVTKTWKDRLNSFFQIVFRNGGRTGVGFQLGLNYTFDWLNPFSSKTKSKSSKNNIKKEMQTQGQTNPQKTIIKSMSEQQRMAYKQINGKTVIKSLSMK